MKVGAIQTGDDVINTDMVTLLRTMTYSIPTCGGSSGAMVMSFVVKDDQVTEYMATHCRGGGKTCNISGTGQVYLPNVTS